MANKTIKDIVIENADALKAMTTHTELREWAISQGFNNRSAFPKFKLALNEIGLDYDVIKTGIKKQKSEELKAKINYELTLYSDAKASAGRYGITDKDGNVVWHGRFFENDNASEQSSAELEASKKAVWFASKVKEALNEPAIKLTLYVDAEWLTYQDHSGQKGYALTTLASKYDIQLEVLWISGKKNPADKWTVASGFKKWQDNDLKSLADYIKDIDIPESDNELEIKEQDEDKTPSDVIENNTNNDMENNSSKIEESKTVIFKNIRGDWQAETIRTEKGQTFQITTMKRYSGELVTSITKVEAKQDDNVRIVSYGMNDDFMDIRHGKVRVTESVIKEAHYKALAEFDIKVSEMPEKEIRKEEAEKGDILFLDGYGKSKGSYGNNWIIYDIKNDNYGIKYFCVEKDTLELAIKDHIRPYSKKFGIGTYFEKGYDMVKFGINEDILSNMLIEAQDVKKDNEEKKKILVEIAKDKEEEKAKYLSQFKNADRKKTTAIIKKYCLDNFKISAISVSTDVYSGGNSMNVKYTSTEPIKELESWINNFQEGHFNGMEDIYEYDRNRSAIIVDGYILETYKYVFVRHVAEENNINESNESANDKLKSIEETSTSEISNNSNDKPTPESKQRFSAIKEIDRKEITVMPELFQGRQNAYSEESVNKIVSEGFDKTNDPIIVWYDKDIEKYVVISGHSRWEASKRLFASGDVSLQTMPVKEYLGDKEESLNYAILESNRASTQEGLISDINAVRKMLVQGYNKTEMIKYIKPKSYLEKIINYTYLNPTGKFIEYLASDSKISFPYLERNAEWVGILRNMYGSKLTNSHEIEIFDYIYLTDKKGLSLRKDELFNMIERKAGSLIFNPEEPLNLKNLGNVSPLVNPVIEIIKEHEKEISEMEKEISHKQDLIVRANNEGKTDLIDRFKSDISNLTTRILNEKTIVDRLNSQINTISKQSIYDLFSEIPAPIETKKILNLSEQDVANDEVIKCNAELDNYKNELNVSIPQINQIFTINGQKAILTNIDSYKLTFSIDDGKYNMKMVKLYTYSEIIEMFNNGNIKYDGYDNSTSEGKLNFENILTKKQLCLAKTENLNSLIHLKDKTEIILTSNLLNTNELNNQLSQKENEIKQIKEVVEEQNKPAEIDDKTLYLQAIEGLNILLELETNKKEIKSIKDAIEGLNIMVEL